VLVELIANNYIFNGIFLITLIVVPYKILSSKGDVINAINAIR
jgi:hypothetical protein